MSDEMKLLQALCEALGFLVEVETDYQEYSISENESINNKFRMIKLDSDGRYMTDENGSYITKLKHPAIAYKLIKKEDIKGELVL